MSFRPIVKSERPPDAELEVASSKSVTHRALIAAALAGGRSLIRQPLDADDTRVTQAGLSALGIEIREEAGALRVEGSAGRPPGGGSLSLRDSGTSLRLLLAVACLGQQPSRLDGSQRLRQRPIGELIRALREMGATIRSESDDSDLPLWAGGSTPRGGAACIAADLSSQFASALLMIAPVLAQGLELQLAPGAVSLPYIRLTAGVLSDFGVPVEQPSEQCWKIPRVSYEGREYAVEGDHSTASYFLAAPAILGGRVRVRGLAHDSAQPDARLGQLLGRLGCTVRTGDDWIEVQGDTAPPGFDLNLADAPDLVPTLAVLALFAEGPSVIRGVAHLRHKESDRLAVLADNLSALGRPAVAVLDRLEIGPSAGLLRGGRIRTASDHRMAMAFAIAGLRLGGVVIDDAECVAKSNPGFWDQLSRLS